MKKNLLLTKQLGFRDQAPDSTSNAFIRYLQRQSAHASKASPNKKSSSKIVPEQLSFEFMQDLALPRSRKRKSS